MIGRWADVEKVVTGHLRAVTGVRVVTRLPADLTGAMPLHRVTRGPGGDDDVTDAPLVDVETFAADRAGMWTAAEDAREAMHSLSGAASGGALVDTVTTAGGPQWVDYENPAVQRAVASYRLTQRRTFTTP